MVAGDGGLPRGISLVTEAKVFPQTSVSAVAIAGAAGPAIQMVRVFQLQPSTEKIEGKPLTLEVRRTS